MLPPPDLSDPFAGTWNDAFPVPDGGIAATFTAYGWVRALFNDAIPQAAGDFRYVSTFQGGTYI